MQAKTHEKTKKTGGVTAMQFLSLRQYDETGDLFIEVYPESVEGHPTLITADIFKRLRDRSKGLAQSRFNYHITEKSHKSENDLIDDCFGFADMLRHASDDELPKVKKYIRSNRSARRREMLLGALTHEMKTPMTAIIGFSGSSASSSNPARSRSSYFMAR